MTDWTDEMVTIAVGMKRAGFTAKAIGKRLGVPHHAVQKRLHRMGVHKTLTGKAHARPRAGRLVDSCLSPVLED